ncbi:GAF domain-containing protein [Celerinatantimonas sp. MCCC 1A17872]|uniref:GAF domain-containing protein n=1 Tax=Celerinatantimonas sp. MCCC 1A17872 TaxID=3177514 RepID=UPI0038C379A9
MNEKAKFYERLTQQAEAFTGPDVHWLSTLANTAALLWMELDTINWAGFYLKSGEQLVLGPFQGNPACTNIDIGKGVCGTAFAQRKPLVVTNVHEFPGHIACDAASESEIVLPFYAKSQLVGVLDIDSPILNRFDQHDESGLQKLLNLLANALPDIEF